MKDLRPEAEGFVLGVNWSVMHMLVAADRMQNKGFRAAATNLILAAEELRTAAKPHAVEIWPPFDPIPPGSKNLLGPG